jgi:glucose/mannose-6-phosphate isomerase
MSMRDVILASPEQITHSLEVNKKVKVKGKVDSMIMSCIGGSGHPGDLLNALHLPTVPLIVHRGYNLPKFFGKKPLVITSSYSGNTEEPLTGYMAARKAGYPILANTSGGKILDWATRDGVPVTSIDFPDMQPRHTLYASFVGLATALANSNLSKDVSKDLKRVAKVLEKKIPQLEKPAKELAARLKNKVPMYYASLELAFAAKNFKIQTNENAKTPAFWSDFPELNHNEMVGFSNPTKGYSGKFHVVMLRNTDDHPRTKIRMDVTADLYKKWGVEVTNFQVEGTTNLEKIFYAVAFGMWTTMYLAEEYGIDPVPVAGVEEFKSNLEKIAGKVG